MDVGQLRVYQQALDACRQIENIAQQLPKDLFDVKRQIFRSSRAIAPIIAEGFGRKRSQKEFHRFVIEAMSSSDETITHLRIIARSRFNTISIKQLKEAAETFKSISRQLNTLSSKVRENI
ncbi:four helix bundle protein [Candidatus Gottesmanbacteria bacterium]|nr:four helix bundle protein [Candidatus Gottesmanbacteria bacterium]